jgi:hypothetical protein
LDRDSFVLPGILILVLVIILVVVVAFSGPNTFNNGQISFQYPAGWSQASSVGNFSNESLYSEVTLTTSVTDTNGKLQTAYIIIQMQQKTQGALNLPSTTTIVANTTNSSVSSVNVNNFTATQLGSSGANMAEKTTIIEYKNYYFVITFISPPQVLNQTSDAYNTLLKTLKID